MSGSRFRLHMKSRLFIDLQTLRLRTCLHIDISNLGRSGVYEIKVNVLNKVLVSNTLRAHFYAIRNYTSGVELRTTT